jgi:dihydrofolate reductase
VARIVASQHVSLDGVIEAPEGTKQYVVSSTLDSPISNYAAMLDGDPVEEVARLRAEAGSDVVVHGSARLLQTLLEHGLLDELRLMVHPVVQGTGERAFGETSGKRRLRLKTADEAGDGITVLVYESAGEERGFRE